MKKLVITLVIACLAFGLQAQKNSGRSVVYLHDGSQIKGEITENQGLDFISLKLNGGEEEIQIPRKTIKSIVELEEDLLFFKNGKYVKTKGLYKIIHTGIAPAMADDTDNVVWGSNTLHAAVGYQFNQYLAVGGGVGLDVYSNSFIPFYADFRGYILQRKVSPFYAFQAGYSLSNDLFNNYSDNVSFKGGMMIHPTLGLRFASFKHTKILFEAGYKFQWDTRTYDWNENVDNIIFKRLTLKFGWLF